MADYPIDQYVGIVDKQNVNVVHLYFPELGDMSIHYQDAPFTGKREVVLYPEFDVSAISVVDRRGNDHKVES
jgi:hypothetical protein